MAAAGADAALMSWFGVAQGTTAEVEAAAFNARPYDVVHQDVIKIRYGQAAADAVAAV